MGRRGPDRPILCSVHARSFARMDAILQRLLMETACMVYGYMQSFLNMYIHTYIYICIYICVYMYIYMYCIYIYVYTHAKW